MRRVLIIGANGQIARLLIPKLIKKGILPRAMVRKIERSERLIDLGAEVVDGDLESPEFAAQYQAALDGVDAVVFAAGSGAKTGADKTLLVDLWGAVKTIRLLDQLHQKGESTRRYLMVSSRRADDPDKSPEKLKPYVVAKYFADEDLLRSKLHFTLLRPGRLINEEAVGGFTSVAREELKQVISREDVADAIAYCLSSDSTVGKVRELYRGNSRIEEVMA